MGQVYLDTALMTIAYLHYRRAPPFPLTSGKLALLDVSEKPEYGQDVVLVLCVGRPEFMRFRSGIYETGLVSRLFPRSSGLSRRAALARAGPRHLAKASYVGRVLR